MKTRKRDAAAAPAGTVQKSAIDQASEEPAALVKSQGTTGTVETPAEMLAKSAEATAAAAAGTDLKKGDGPGDGEGPGGQVISGGKGGDRGTSNTDEGSEDEDGDDEYEEDDEDEDSEKSLRGAFYGELLQHPEYGDVMEASPALEHMTEVMGKSFEFLGKQNRDLRSMIKAQQRQIDSLVRASVVTQQALAANMKSQAPGMVKSQAPGVIGRAGNMIQESRDDAKAGGSKLSKSEITHRISRALTDGKLGPDGGDILVAFDARGDVALSRIPADIRKAYEIPDPAV